MLKSIFSKSCYPKDSSYQSKSNNILYDYLSSFKEYRYISAKKIFIVLFKDILGYFKQIIDCHFIFFITLISILIRSIFKSKTNITIYNNVKFYSLYYWTSRGSKSAEYYFPNIYRDNSSKLFITSFAQNKFLSFAYIHSLFFSDYLSPANTITITRLFISIFQFFHLFFHDIYLLFRNKPSSILSIWYGWKKMSIIFYSFLTYNSVMELTINSNNCEFISWYENHFNHRAFALGFSKAKCDFNVNSSLSSYYGSPFSLQGKSQYIPTKFDFDIGLWGSKFYFQDKYSLLEMKHHLENQNIDVKLEIVGESMVRIDPPQFNKSKTSSIGREITIFSHDSYVDLINCILSLLNQNTIKRTLFEKENILLNINTIFLRLHPSLDRKKALRKISETKEIPIFIKFNFIDYDESIIDTMYNSKICVFGLSTYINLALRNNCFVIASDSNHIYKPQLQLDCINSPNLILTSPW